MEISMEQNQQQRQGGINGAFDEDGRIKRTGTVWSASAHIIAAVIDPGILSLAWTMALLGWVAGPIVIIFFAFVTFYTSSLLAECYRTGDPITGERNCTYSDAVHSYLGGVKVKLCGFIQYLNLIGMVIRYTSDSSTSIITMANKGSDCFQEIRRDNTCNSSSKLYVIIFGVIEIIFSQIHDFDQIWWLSIVAVVMSFTYSFIGLGLATSKVIANQGVDGSLGGFSINSIGQAEKAWIVLGAIGIIALNYPFSIILIEIQDTIKAPPLSEAKVIKKAIYFSVAVITFFYMVCGCMGYAAFGEAPGNLLTVDGFENPFWLVGIANTAIIIHLVGAYQLFSQPLFAFIEKWANRKWPNSKFISKKIRIPFTSYKLKLFRLVWRSAFVLVTTLIPILCDPLMDDVVLLLSIIGFWPLTIYFPIEMYTVQKKVTKWSFRWFCLQMSSFACLILILAVAVGAVAVIISDSKVYDSLESGA